MGNDGLAGLVTNICGAMWSVTPYDRCDIRCVYCCTRAQGASEPVGDLAAVRAEARRWRDRAEGQLFLVGAFSDGYPSPEAELGLTRAVLEELVPTGAAITVITKSTTVLRDLDLLVAAGPAAHVQVSLCSLDDDVLRRLEPGAPTAGERLDAIEAIRAAGVRVGLNALPWIPDVTDTAALIDAVHPDVELVFSPLATGADRDAIALLGRRHERPEIWARYLQAYEAFGHVPNTSWVKPSLPPDENHPIARLPVRIDLGPRRPVLASRP